MSDTQTPSRTFSTPMMQQYARLKESYSDCLLLYRLGDFYELFLDDALIGARVLNIVLTKRPRGKDGDIPMAGVPYHAADRYIAKLVASGYKVAMCEQVSDPKEKGLVKRDVVRIITPGTVLDEQSLNTNENNFIISLVVTPEKLGIAIADVSTGRFEVTERLVEDSTWEVELRNELERFHPAEVLVHDTLYNNPEILFVLTSTGTCVTRVPDWDDYTFRSRDVLLKQFQVSSLRGFGCEHDEYAIEAAAALIGYLNHTQQGSVSHIVNLKKYDVDECVILDASTVSNLELFVPLQQNTPGHVGTLLDVLDETQSALGGRMIREWLRRPLRNKVDITNRLVMVEYFVQHSTFRENIRSVLKSMYDIERIISRLSLGTGHIGDIVNAAATIKLMLSIRTQCLNEHAREFDKVLIKIDENLNELVVEIQTMLVENPPLDVRGGGFIASGIHTELDELRSLLAEDTSWVTRFEQSERERTGIGTLKIRHNSVFGYYIEVSKSYRNSVPKEYVRTQTLVNAERYTTEELRSHEQRIVSAHEKICTIEYELSLKLISKIVSHTSFIQDAARAIATIDCVAGLAYRAEKSSYVRPEITSNKILTIEHGRHPVVEARMHGIQFVPNSVQLDPDSTQVHIITGPNMAGKSVYMRQVALITLMTHIGAFVPAHRAQVCLVDRICVRSGASDMITSGLSTFMVEMVETAYILNHATEKSLIILDEIGRGTSTYDGISIAWAVAKYLVTHWKSGPKTLFATHYHELQDLEKDFPQKIFNAHMAVEDHHGKPIFLHRVVPGPSSHSYGVAVAKLAGVPIEVIEDAQKMLHTLEKNHTHGNNS